MESNSSLIYPSNLPNSFVAVALAKHIKIYECPSRERNIEPLVLFKKYLGGHHAEIKSFTWSPDSR